MVQTIFVFGSNLAGRHGKGAALEARLNWGAIYTRGLGRCGNSYAIATKDENLNTLSLDAIRLQVEYYFRSYINIHKNDTVKLIYKVTAIGCGLAGYSPKEIAPMFSWAVNYDCVYLPKEFIELLSPE